MCLKITQQGFPTPEESVSSSILNLTGGNYAVIISLHFSAYFLEIAFLTFFLAVSAQFPHTSPILVQNRSFTSLGSRKFVFRIFRILLHIYAYFYRTAFSRRFFCNFPVWFPDICFCWPWNNRIFPPAAVGSCGKKRRPRDPSDGLGLGMGKKMRLFISLLLHFVWEHHNECDGQQRFPHRNRKTCFCLVFKTIKSEKIPIISRYFLGGGKKKPMNLLGDRFSCVPVFSEPLFY